MAPEKDYDAFPAALRPVAQEACETLLQTRDGQLCDVIVDRGCLEAICHAGRASDEAIIRDYAERPWRWPISKLPPAVPPRASPRTLCAGRWPPARASTPRP
ncbi:MAG: hypothetical protein V8S89_02705 [Oscillospiraceae bacterium]